MPFFLFFQHNILAYVLATTFDFDFDF